MDSQKDSLKWDAMQRMEEIERLLYWQGSVGRQELALRFKLSNPQTTAILKKYSELNPGKIALNQSTKRYEVDDSIKNLFYQPSFEDLISKSAELNLNAIALEPPSRRADLSIVREISRATMNEKSIEITYHSKDNPEGLFRVITPHSFVNTGKRTHVRAWCHLRRDYRDFVIGRISKTGKTGLAGKGILEDDAWNTKVILKLKANPELPTEVQKLIEMDFEMEDGIREIKVRQAMLLYYLGLYDLQPSKKRDQNILQDVVLADCSVLKFI